MVGCVYLNGGVWISFNGFWLLLWCGCCCCLHSRGCDDVGLLLENWPGGGKQSRVRLLGRCGDGDGWYLLDDGRNCVLARTLRLLLLDLLVDQVVRHCDGVRLAGDGDNAIPGARREFALLRDVDVGTRQLLDLHKTSATGSCQFE